VFTGVFDMEPELTQGCSSSIVCYVNTPYSLNHRGGVEVSTAANASIGKWTEFYHFGVSSQLAFLRQETWAVWTRSVESVASVPEPASAALLLAGIAGLVLSRRHAKR